MVFWGSQSGTAESFAIRLARECQLRYGLKTISADLSDYDAETIAKVPATCLTVFILSTFGEGDPSDNTSGLWQWLHKTTQVPHLPNLRYVAFGLGNSNYKYYNRVVDVVVSALDKAGASSLMPVSKADDSNGGTEEHYLSWKDELFGMFRNKLGYEEQDMPFVPSFEVAEDVSLDVGELQARAPVIQQQQQARGKAASKTSPIHALTVRNARELFKGSDRNCLEVELDLSKYSELRYKTGDHLAIYPVNPDHEVQLLARALGLQDRLDTPIALQPLNGDTTKLKLPSPTTGLMLLSRSLDICARVSRDTIRGLIPFAPSPDARELLSSLANDKDKYAAFVGKNHVNFGRLLNLAAPTSVWTDLPLAFVLEGIPPMKPRYYSISSSPMLAPRRPSVVAVVENTTLSTGDTSAITIPGLTTNYILQLSSGLQMPQHLLEHPPQVFASVRRSKFKPPLLGTTPLIMIGAGTGIAPFRAFIQERERQKVVGKPIGRMLLFYGCRRPDEDFIFQEELEQAVKTLDGALEVITAFSRSEGKEKKVYVQDRIAERMEEVCDQVQDSATIYICGRANMARDVGNVITGAMRTRNNWDEREEKEWADAARRGNKWLEDVWG